MVGRNISNGSQCLLGTRKDEGCTLRHVHLGRDHAALRPRVAGVAQGAAHVVHRIAHAAAEGVRRAAVAPLHLVPALPILRSQTALMGEASEETAMFDLNTVC